MYSLAFVIYSNEFIFQITENINHTIIKECFIEMFYLPSEIISCKLKKFLIFLLLSYSIFKTFIVFIQNDWDIFSTVKINFLENVKKLYILCFGSCLRYVRKLYLVDIINIHHLKNSLQNSLLFTVIVPKKLSKMIKK